MNIHKKITKIFNEAEEINFNNCSRFVLMSDCHRGDGNIGDNFSKNQNIYFHALNYYYLSKYTYIELGDGDELWELKKMEDIKEQHIDVFWMLSRFYKENRLYLIRGNHDIVKKDEQFVKDNLYEYYDEHKGENLPLFKDIKIHEGIVLKHKETGGKILLIHGHQADPLNYEFWRLSRFLVRYLWKPLENFAVNDPTRAAKNNKKKNIIDKKLSKWVEEEKTILVAGHTHKPIFPSVGETPYFNDGSCVHPRCITAIEVADGKIGLIKWHVKSKLDGTLAIAREVLVGPVDLKEYFNFLNEAREYNFIG